MLTCFAPGAASFGPRPDCPHALLAGMLNASLLAVPLWLLILHGLGII